MNTPSADTQVRSKLARLSLDGLSIGDAFGQQFFFPGVLESCDPLRLPDPPWEYTDDTEMAISIVRTLEDLNTIEQDHLAAHFVDRFQTVPHRGYGAGARELLESMAKGGDWRVLSKEMFGGAGSYGNGAAMRAAPIGAWFGDDIELVIQQAQLSAEVTHAHPEGQAGAVAVALAASWANGSRKSENKRRSEEMLPWIVSHLPNSEIRKGIERAAQLPFDTWQFDVAAELGSGHQVTAQDTVPFCLWMAAAHLHDFCEAMWTTARVGGDIDTNCAIIGGIISLNVGTEGIPQQWRDFRERLKA